MTTPAPDDRAPDDRAPDDRAPDDRAPVDRAPVDRAPVDPDCLFCRIVAGTVPCEVVHESATTLAFRDVAPGAPTHVLVVPRDHHADAAALADAVPSRVAEMVGAAAAVARQEGLTGGYRLVWNTGPDAGQTVPHVHLHVLGGRGLGWPPG